MTKQFQNPELKAQKVPAVLIELDLTFEL